MTISPRTALTNAEIEAFSPAEKIGLITTINPEGLPHITLITSLTANGPHQLTLGEFSRGKSKEHLASRPETAFLVMTMDRRMWRGRAAWTHCRQEGPEYERYNNLPMFRYNAYFGINTVHYLDLAEVTGPAKLPLGRIVAASLLNRALAGRRAEKQPAPALKPYAEKKIFNNLGALKFLGWITPAGRPALVPVLPARAADSGRLVLTSFPYGRELAAIPDGTVVAVFGLTLVMESVLVRGRLHREKTGPGLTGLVVDIDWVYNSMPPCHGPIYPPRPLEPVRHFE